MLTDQPPDTDAASLRLMTEAHMTRLQRAADSGTLTRRVATDCAEGCLEFAKIVKGAKWCDHDRPFVQECLDALNTAFKEARRHATLRSI